jgi:O-antigen ligase
MNNAPAILRTFIIYAMIVPLAMFIGYLLANPQDYATLALYGTLALLLLTPLLLRWHHWLLLLSWNLALNLFFLKGSPAPWLLMTGMSLGISILQRALSRQSQFIKVPEITLPLIFMTLVVAVTAKMTGGFGLRTFGSDVYGGKKYVFTLGAILGYFALTAVRIPIRYKRRALALFFLGGTTALIGELYGRVPSGLNFIFWFFTPDLYSFYNAGEVTRYSSAVSIATGITSYMLAYYGIQGMFLARKPWRWIFFGLASAAGLLAGFRGFAGALSVVFLIQFFLEGMHRTKLLPILGMIGMATVFVVIPLTPKMPLTVQRSLAFLPLPIDPAAKLDADVSWEWRVKMWQALLPQIPEHLLLGKGYGFSSGDFEFMGGDSAFRSVDAGQQSLALSSDYHNGWLSVLLTFGIWGIIVFVWFAFAAIYVLFCNYRYGDPGLRTVNAFLLATFIVRFLLFMSISGLGLHNDLYSFVGWLGLGVCLNGGVCRKPVPQPVPFKRPLLGPAKHFPQPRPAFQR